MANQTKAFPFPSAAIRGKKEPRLEVTDLGENTFQFQIVGTPQITGVYKKFNLFALTEEAPDEKYGEITDKPVGHEEEPTGQILHHSQTPLQDVQVRVVWYHRSGDGKDTEIKISKLNDPVDFVLPTLQDCVRGRIYIVNSPSESDTGDPIGDDPPWFTRQN